MSRPPRARWVATAVAAVLLTAAGLTVASPAYAVEQFPLTDSFEGDPYDRWTVSEVPGLTNVTMGAHTIRGRTDTNLAFLNAYPPSPATATIFRTITPDDRRPWPIECEAELYIARVANQGEPPPTTVDVILRIRRGGPTGPIISNKSVTIRTTTDWVGRTFNPIPWPTSTITVEIGAYAGSALVDDLAFRCYPT
jgi:hypothetical protein